MKLLQKRQKRLRLKERKKAAAVARDGFSLDPTPTQANNNDFESKISNPDLNQESEVEMLKQTETGESQDEASSSSLNVQQQTDKLLELVEGNEEALMAQHRTELKGQLEAQLREKVKGQGGLKPPPIIISLYLQNPVPHTTHIYVMYQ